MARVYISHSGIDQRLVSELIRNLVDLEHTITEMSMEPGSDVKSRIRDIIDSASIFLVLISNESLSHSKRFYDEMIQLRNYATHSRDKMLIPIFVGNVSLDQIPESIANIQGIGIPNENPDSVRVLAKKIDEAISLFFGKSLAQEKEKEVIKEKIENTAPIYIENTIKELTQRENRFRLIGLFWYGLGFITLIAGVSAAVWLSNNGLSDFNGKEIWSKTVFYGIKSLVIIVLLIAASKYSFNLAKSYMNESLKISDRIHAISFGKFYLQVFDQQLRPEELKDIFRDWNINNQSSFVGQKSSEYDPKLLEFIVGIMDKLKGPESKK